MEPIVEMIDNLIITLNLVKESDKEWRYVERILALIDWIDNTKLMLEHANLIKESEDLFYIGNMEELYNIVKNDVYFPIVDIDFFILNLQAFLHGLKSKYSEIKSQNELIPLDMIDGCSTVINKIAEQVNGCYKNGYYDACLIMIRRLIEKMIIDCFIKYKIEDEKISSKNMPDLSDLITLLENENKIFIDQKIRKRLIYLKDLTKIANQATHSISFITDENTIKRYEENIKIAIMELARILTQQTEPKYN